MRAFVVTAAALAVVACSRADAPAPSPTPPPPASEAGEQPTGVAASEASESPTEVVDVTVPLGDLTVIPGLDEEWVPLTGPTTVRRFDRWLRARGVSGEAARLARDMDEQYGFEREVRAAYVHAADPDAAPFRTRQVLVTQFTRFDEDLSEAWCSVDEEGRDAVDLGSSRRVQRAVNRLLALPGSCGAVRDVGEGDHGFQADISFRRGPLVVQVVAVEPEALRSLVALAEIAPRVADRVVELTD